MDKDRYIKHLESTIECHERMLSQLKGTNLLWHLASLGSKDNWKDEDGWYVYRSSGNSESSITQKMAEKASKVLEEMHNDG